MILGPGDRPKASARLSGEVFLLGPEQRNRFLWAVSKCPIEERHVRML
jgi:hypothetical protein